MATLNSIRDDQEVVEVRAGRLRDWTPPGGVPVGPFTDMTFALDQMDMSGLSGRWAV